MTAHSSLPPAPAQRMAPGPFRILSASAADRSPPLSPPKSWAWWIERNGCRIGPPTCGGTAVIGEATDGDGDENSSRDKRHLYQQRTHQADNNTTIR